MDQKPLEFLKKGLEILEKSVKGRKDRLEACLAERKSISFEDEWWLDNEANSVDERRIILQLELASDYGEELMQLDEKAKEIVKKLIKWAGNGAKITSLKRKRPEKRQVTEKINDILTNVTPESSKKENATLEQRIEILDWFCKNGRNQTATARHFTSKYPNLQLKQPLISSWVKEEAKWRQRWLESQSERNRSARRIRQTEHPKITEMMDLWISTAMDPAALNSGEVLREKWIAFADLAGIPQHERLALSNGWLEKLKERHNLKGLKRQDGACFSIITGTVEEERWQIQSLIKHHGYEQKDIFTMAETGLFYAMPPDKGLCGNQQHRVAKGPGTRLTYALTSNADGTEKLQPFVIGKAKNPRSFRGQTGATLGFNYRSNALAWMTMDFYQDWIKQWDSTLGRKGRKILLLQNNISGHVVPDNLQNIRVVNFASNSTMHGQPMDQGIIRCFKAHYRRKFIQRATMRYDQDITPSQIYDITQLQGMRLAEQAWNEVDITTIQSSWNKAGILPESSLSPYYPSTTLSFALGDNPDLTSTDDPINSSETGLENALDDLVSRGALQPNNRLPIEALLNPQNELYAPHLATDQEIHWSVMTAKQARKKADENGDNVDDEDGPLQPCPTRREALQAISVINRFLEERNDPQARQLEELLASLMYDRCGPARIEQKPLRNASLLDYFSRA